MKKLSILVVLLVAMLNSFAENIIKNNFINNKENGEIYYTGGYYDKKSNQIVITHEINTELINAYNELSIDCNNVSSSLDGIEIIDDNPLDINNPAYYYCYGTTSDGGSFSTTIQVLKFEKDDRIYYELSNEVSNKTTHHCKSKECKPKCSFNRDSNNQIIGCNPCSGGGECTYSKRTTSDESVRTWLLLFILQWSEIQNQ